MRPVRQHVLLVEDEALIALSLVDELEAAGFRVSWFASGDDALNAAMRDRPDVAVLDWRVRDLSEAQLLRALRASVPGLPALIVTGYQVRSEDLADSGPGDTPNVLAKPVEGGEVVSAVLQLVAAR